MWNGGDRYSGKPTISRPFSSFVRKIIANIKDPTRRLTAYVSNHDGDYLTLEIFQYIERYSTFFDLSTQLSILLINTPNVRS